MSWNCEICQKEMDTNGPNTDTNYSVSFYHGKRPASSESFIMCETCYQAKEQEYLKNYRRIFKETEKEGLVWIKEDEKDCYAGHKDQNGKILKQKDCPHCQPWKHNDNDNPEKCVNCDKVVGNSCFVGNGKTFCSIECIDAYRKKNSPPQKSSIIPPKNNNNGNRDIPPPWKMLGLRKRHLYSPDLFQSQKEWRKKWMLLFPRMYEKRNTLQK